ncbi:hypothetical protein FQA47_010085 [Oryzias melastigma]|uniref:Uncharacterized protein n=1 Tax=Oryzias melastigma TaxID=30732 RepID=A0A834FHU9_ORYME|nr:hypothetical protein FQA47_010085 [Oryzias melastigma]
MQQSAVSASFLVSIHSSGPRSQSKQKSQIACEDDSLEERFSVSHTALRKHADRWGQMDNLLAAAYLAKKATTASEKRTCLSNRRKDFICLIKCLGDMGDETVKHLRDMQPS